jgi:plastocyanin
MLRSRLLSSLGVGLLSVGIAACGGSSSGGGGGSPVSCTPGAAAAPSAAATAPASADSSGSSPAAGFTVCVDSDPSAVGKYNPDNATVKSGSSVTWIFTDQAAQHTVTFDDGSYDSGPQSSGYTTTQKITKPAGTTIAYHCTLHAQMTGKVTVN